MKKRHPFRSWLVLLGVGLVGALGNNTAYSQAISEDQVKAAYLFNFASFVEWPQETFPRYCSHPFVRPE